MNSLLLLDNIIGTIDDETYSERIHTLSHEGNIEYINIDPIDLSRKKFRAKTTTGRSCAISLSRDAKLENGSILYIENNLAIVLKTNEIKWLKLKPINLRVALELGYFAGNMHWQVRFTDDYICIALNSSRDTYINRLSEFLNKNLIEIISNE